MLGVSLTSTGVRAASFTHSVIICGVLRHLADGGAHAALAHAVRTAEVQLQAIGARAFRALDHLAPGLTLRLDHERRDDRVAGIEALDLGNLAQVDLDGPVADELDVVEAHHALRC